MKKYIQMGLISLLIVSFFSACEHMGTINNPAETNSFMETTDEEEVQTALQEDAELARTMPLKQFAKHMKQRHAYYKQFTTTYKDDFVMIVIEENKMRIETPKGKVKVSYTE
jgi:hypothetical protein